MTRFLRLAAALFGLVALAQPPAALAQTPSAPAGTARPAPGVPTQRPAPGAPAVPAPSAAAPAPKGTAVVNTAPSPAAAGGKVDINAASAEQLDALPGIGPVRSKAIVAGRPYADLQDLVTKKVLTQGVLDGAKSRMALANINSSSAADLAKTLPGVGDVRSKAIVAGRPYASADDLVKKNILTQGVFDKIKDLVAY